jgi:DMSO reductase anchor subunit
MHPAFSVIFLTTLIGAGQGLFLALYSADIAGALQLILVPDGKTFFALGSLVSFLLSGLGLMASFFHLGRPERAWRSAAMWRTSWLSREVIVLPAFMAAVFFYGVGHFLDWHATLATGMIAAVLCVALFVCTGMIYACIKFLQEWASPLTVVNYLLLGCASGFTLATAFAAFTADNLVQAYGVGAMGFTLVGLATRTASLIRNSRIKFKSTLQSAIGVHHPHIAQKSQGFMGGSFNTREFFHGRTKTFLRSVKWAFLALTFALPLLLLASGLSIASVALLCAAFIVQFAGLIAERWFFFAQANHPQNLYYQTIS